jgi:hypothetical protein
MTAKLDVVWVTTFQFIIAFLPGTRRRAYRGRS